MVLYVCVCVCVCVYLFFAFLAIAEGVRPDIPPELPTSIQQLIGECWDGDPSTRPAAVEIVDTLHQEWETSFGTVSYIIFFVLFFFVFYYYNLMRVCWCACGLFIERLVCGYTLTYTHFQIIFAMIDVLVVSFVSFDFVSCF